MWASVSRNGPISSGPGLSSRKSNAPVISSSPDTPWARASRPAVPGGPWTGIGGYGESGA